MVILRHIIQTALLLCTLLVLLTPAIRSNDLAAGALSAKYFWLYGTALCGGVCLLAALLIRRMQVTVADLLLLCFFLYLALQSWITGAELLTVKKFWQLLSGVMLYGMIRYLLRRPAVIRSNMPVLMLVMLVTVWIALFTGLLQYMGWAPSLNYYHPVTGTFFHPAPFAMLLCTVFPVAVYISAYYAKRRQWERWLYYCAVPLCLFIPLALYFLDSRAAWAAAVAGLLIVLPVRERVSRWVAKGWGRWAAATIVMILLAVAGYIAVAHRPASVSGRLLVWKISAGMLAEKPVAGHGLDRFRELYPLYQIRYFSSGHYTPEEAMLADEVTATFNEPFQLAIEIGIPGAILLMALIGYIIFQCARQNRQGNGLLAKGAGGALLSLTVFALSSYPFTLSEGIMLLFAFMAFAVSGLGESVMIRNQRLAGWLPVVFVTIAITLLGTAAPQKWKEVKGYHQWRMADTATDTTMAAKHYAAAQTMLPGNEAFAGAYARFLFRTGAYKESMKVLQQMKGARYNDLLLHGKVSGKLGDNKDAVLYFTQAHLLLPHRFVPLFHLMETYEADGDLQRAALYAQQIMDMPVKVESMDIYTMKDAAAKLLALSKN